MTENARQALAEETIETIFTDCGSRERLYGVLTAAQEAPTT